MGQPIDPNLWSHDAEPHLMGGRLPSGEIVFPMPVGDAANGVEPYKLSRRGTLCPAIADAPREITQSC